jgi:hypothetical protein
VLFSTKKAVPPQVGSLHEKRAAGAALGPAIRRPRQATGFVT